MHENEYYHRWLGILPSEMPTHAYRMLGIELFEPNEDAISDAIDRRRTQLRSYLQGADAEPAATMLNVIEQIGQCLLDPELRTTYDATLRSFLSSQQTFIVRFDDAPSEINSNSLEILPDEADPAMAQPGPSFASLPMIPMPTQGAGAAAKGRRKKEKNVFVEIAKIIGGGIAGLLLGYLVLSYVNPDNDLFRSMGIGPNQDKHDEHRPVDQEKVRVDDNEKPMGQRRFRE